MFSVIRPSREALRLSIEPERFSNTADSLSLLKDRGIDLNTPSFVTIIEPDSKRDESYTMGQLVVEFGHRKQSAYNTHGNDRLYYRFIDDMDGGNGTSLFNQYMNRRALKEKLQHYDDLGIHGADDDSTKILFRTTVTAHRERAKVWKSAVPTS